MGVKWRKNRNRSQINELFEHYLVKYGSYKQK